VSRPEPERQAPRDKRSPGQAHEASGASRRQLGVLIVSIAVVVVIVAAVHWPVLSAQALSLDDAQYLTDNRLVRNPSWASTRRFVTELLAPSTVRGYAQPMTMISLMLDYAAGGRPNDLRQFHRTNLALHVANTALLIVLLYQLFGSVWPAAGIGLLFGVHPLVVEPIAWLTERKTLLAAFFVLWCLVLYVCFVHRRSWGVYAACLTMFVLAVLSKPTSTPLPVLLLLLDAWPLRRLSWRAVIESLPFFGIAAIGAVITVISQARTAGVDLPIESAPGEMLLMLCHQLVFYLSKMVWPANLSSWYPRPEPMSLSNPALLGAVIGMCAIIAVVAVSLRWTRAVAVGWLFFFVAILPTLGIIGFTWATAADKYVYLPAVGLLLVLASFACWLSNASSQRRQRRLIQAAGAVVLIVLASLEARATRAYLPAWRDSETLFRHILTVAPNAPVAHNSLGLALAAKGDWDAAIEHYQAALRRYPGYQNARNNLALALASQGRVDEAIVQCQLALEHGPDNPITQNNLGGFLVRQGRLTEAAEHFAQALRLNPEAVETYNNLATVLLALGRVDEAVARLEQALRRDPRYVDAHMNLARAQARLGNADLAMAQYREVLRLSPDHAEAHLNMARICALQQRLDQAVAHYEHVLRLQPDRLDALNALAWLLAVRRGHSRVEAERAVQLAEQACEITGHRMPAVLDTLAAAYAAAGRFAEAVSTAERALELAESAGQKELADDIRNRLELYRAGQPYRPPPRASSAP
jgi:tetratricopeptide (TPR) repeat protein